MPNDLQNIPPGWDYNPAAWGQRLPVIGLAILGFLIAGYLALYQWRIVSWVWDPFFPEGSLKILNSRISHILPIPDAALGAIGYLVDAITGAIGGRARWRTMPWVVILFGIAVGPLGVVSVLLVVLQPMLFDAWCTLCLASAVVSLVMIGPAMDEFLASLQHLKRVSDEGIPFWRVFWGLSGIRCSDASAPCSRRHLVDGVARGAQLRRSRARERPTHWSHRREPGHHCDVGNRAPVALDQCRARRLVADRTMAAGTCVRCALEQSGRRRAHFRFFAGERETHASDRRRLVVAVETAHVERRLTVIASHL